MKNFRENLEAISDNLLSIAAVLVILSVFTIDIIKACHEPCHTRICSTEVRE